MVRKWLRMAENGWKWLKMSYFDPKITSNNPFWPKNWVFDRATGLTKKPCNRCSKTPPISQFCRFRPIFLCKNRKGEITNYNPRKQFLGGLTTFWTDRCQFCLSLWCWESIELPSTTRLFLGPSGTLNTLPTRHSIAHQRHALSGF